MIPFTEAQPSLDPPEIAPDGSEVRFIMRLPFGSMAQFKLDAGRTSRAVQHRTVDEVWCGLSGEAEMWRSLDGEERLVVVRPGTCLTIPVGARFQFRTLGTDPFVALGITTPPWPGDGEAVAVDGAWEPS